MILVKQQKTTIDKKLNSIKKQESSDTLKQKLPEKTFSCLKMGQQVPINQNGVIQSVTEWVNSDVKPWVQDQILAGNKVKVTCDGYASRKRKTE